MTFDFKGGIVRLSGEVHTLSEQGQFLGILADAGIAVDPAQGKIQLNLRRKNQPQNAPAQQKLIEEAVPAEVIAWLSGLKAKVEAFAAE